MKRILLIALIALAACNQFRHAEYDELAAAFAEPPQSAKPMVWWHWMNGNITPEGLRKDILWMNRVGIGGFHVFDAGLDSPQIVEKRLGYMSPEWKEAFAGAIALADSLGMEVAVASSPGWSSTGGPWVTPEDAMKKLTWRFPARGRRQAFRRASARAVYGEQPLPERASAAGIQPPPGRAHPRMVL